MPPKKQAAAASAFSSSEEDTPLTEVEKRRKRDREKHAKLSQAQKHARTLKRRKNFHLRKAKIHDMLTPEEYERYIDGESRWSQYKYRYRIGITSPEKDEEMHAFRENHLAWVNDRLREAKQREQRNLGQQSDSPLSTYVDSPISVSSTEVQGTHEPESFVPTLHHLPLTAPVSQIQAPSSFVLPPAPRTSKPTPEELDALIEKLKSFDGEI